MNRFLLGLLALGLAACGSAQSVTIERVAPGAECKAGGYKVVGAGADQLVCNGASGGSGDAGSSGTSGAPTLLAQSTLPAGDPRCANGGVELRAGLDTGADGGTAGDGVLQPGEVTSRGVVCDGDSTARVGSLTAPPGANGTATLRALGGLASAGAGGRGGAVELRAVSGTNGGHLKAWRTGRADAAFTVPTPPAADLGPVPLAITADTSVAFAPVPGTVPAGTAYLAAQSLYISRGPTLPPDRVTGLSVAAGATLTLPLGAATFTVPGSCRIDGTLRGDPAALLEVVPNIVMSCGDVVFSQSSKVLLSPTDSLSGEHGFEVISAGALLALGTIDTSGFSPPATSTSQPTLGGQVTLRAGGRLYAQGTITTTGGSGTSSFGTSGGDVLLSAELGLYSAATLEASGGRVTPTATIGTLAAGNGGTVQLLVNDPSGEVRNRGAITSNGGVATTGAVSGLGGYGGTITLQSAHGPLTNDAALTALGGEGTTTGGSGGSIFLGISPDAAQGAFGSVLVSGALDVSGGKGKVGGAGGNVQLQLDLGASVGAELALLGYESVDASGGVGLPGGNGGSVLFKQAPYKVTNFYNSTVPVGPGGAVLNALAVRANGGDADTSQTTGTPEGGLGGGIRLSVQTEAGTGASFEVLVNSGALSANGGAGPSGGNAGTLILEGARLLTSSGALSCIGGAASTGGGGRGGGVLLKAVGALSNSAAIDASAGVAGGGAVALNGSGGDISLLAGAVVNSATLTARGGAASLTLGTGGEGGSVTLVSEAAKTQNSVPAPAGIVVSGGTAAKPGAAGAVLIDGASVTDQWTH